MRIGYHASHEQFSPRNLLGFLPLVEEAGFDGVMSSEHIAPWSVRQGNSGFTWAWLGAALQTTKRLTFGALAIPGGWRYHPVIVAHAFATLAQMFPDRFRWIAAGSGEAMNEHVVGRNWPDKNERNERLYQAVQIIRSLWSGETVTEETSVLQSHQAKLWSLPEKLPLIYGAALSKDTADWLGEWADGLITVKAPINDLKALIERFHSGNSHRKPIVLQFQFSWDTSRDQARANAYDQWRHVAANLERDTLQTPEDFDKACAHVQPSDMDKAMLITNSADDIIDHIRTYASLGFDEIYLHNAGRNQVEFISMCKKKILPALK